jgi:hypothetical protein
LDGGLNPGSDVLAPLVVHPIVDGGIPQVRDSSVAAAGVGHEDALERVCAPPRGMSAGVFNVVDSDTEKPIAPKVTLGYLVLYVPTLRGLSTDQHGGDGRAAKLLIDPALDRMHALSLDPLKIGSIYEACGFVVLTHDPDVPDLHNAPDIGVMEAEEYAPRHRDYSSKLVGSGESAPR